MGELVKAQIEYSNAAQIQGETPACIFQFSRRIFEDLYVFKVTTPTWMLISVAQEFNQSPIVWIFPPLSNTLLSYQLLGDTFFPE